MPSGYLRFARSQQLSSEAPAERAASFAAPPGPAYLCVLHRPQSADPTPGSGADTDRRNPGCARTEQATTHAALSRSVTARSSAGRNFGDGAGTESSYPMDDSRRRPAAATRACHGAAWRAAKFSVLESVTVGVVRTAVELICVSAGFGGQTHAKSPGAQGSGRSSALRHDVACVLAGTRGLPPETVWGDSAALSFPTRVSQNLLPEAIPAHGPSGLETPSEPEFQVKHWSRRYGQDFAGG
jgi:hypothetical protein